MADESIELRDQVGVLRRRWKVVAIVLALSLAVGMLALFLLPKTYSAFAEVRLVADPVEGDLTEEAVATEARAVLSYDNVSLTIDELGLSESPAELVRTVEVAPDETGAAVLTITALRSSADEAADIANTLANTYLDATGQAAVQQLVELDAQIEDGQQAISRLRRDLDNATPGTTEFATLRAAVDTEVAELAFLQSQRYEIISDPAGGTETGQIVTPAIPPGAPASPRPVRTMGLAIVVGLMLAVGAAYLRDYFDDVVRSGTNLDKTLDGVAVLGRIPHLRRKDRREPTTLTAPGTPASEAYRALGANVRFLLSDSHKHAALGGDGRPAGRVVVVSSASSAEGRTATAVNLAVVAARAGLKTILVDAELRRPHVGDLLSVPEGPGLADVLAGTTPADKALVNGHLDNLGVLPAGDPPDDPAELLASPKLAEVLDSVADTADLVVVDSPAVLSAADTLELARRADLTMIAVREDVSRVRNVTEAVRRLGQVGANVAGVVLVDVSPRGLSAPRT